jgi:hypothetical protein
VAPLIPGSIRMARRGDGLVLLLLLLLFAEKAGPAATPAGT